VFGKVGVLNVVVFFVVKTKISVSGFSSVASKMKFITGGYFSIMLK
jgi:hypothetical protein